MLGTALGSGESVLGGEPVFIAGGVFGAVFEGMPGDEVPFGGVAEPEFAGVLDPPGGAAVGEEGCPLASSAASSFVAFDVPSVPASTPCETVSEAESSTQPASNTTLMPKANLDRARPATHATLDDCTAERPLGPPPRFRFRRPSDYRVFSSTTKRKSLTRGKPNRGSPYGNGAVRPEVR